MAHATRAELLAKLDSLGVAHNTVEHPPVFTVEESRALHLQLPGMHSKNLFFKDAQDELWLVTAEADRRIDLKSLHHRIGAKRLSFGKPELLMQVLGVIAGSVTPFALINDRSRRVRFFIDKTMESATLLNFHPLENNATTSVTPEGLRKFLAATGHGWRSIDLTAG
jgi:Ala-tRNA(Pro) deacylase